MSYEGGSQDSEKLESIKIARTKRSPEQIKDDIEKHSKICSVCKERKDFWEFLMDRRMPDFFSGRCRKCYYKTHGRKSWLKTYGITPEGYELILTSQSGCCAICKKPETVEHEGKIKNLAVDHDHKTGRVRGLLCDGCNTGLGRFKDSIEALREAIKYLEKQER